MRVILFLLLLIIPSALWGMFCAYKIKTKYTGFIAALVPCLVLLLAILFKDHFLASQDTSGSIWPIAQFIGSALAAGFGYFGYKYSLLYLINKNKSQA